MIRHLQLLCSSSGSSWLWCTAMHGDAWRCYWLINPAIDGLSGHSMSRAGGDTSPHTHQLLL